MNWKPLCMKWAMRLHGILSKTRYTEQSGTSVERDFVEAPSQMYEEWARRLETLSKVADYCEPACPRVDAAMTERLKAVKNYGRGSALCPSDLICPI